MWAVLVREMTVIDPETGAQTNVPMSDEMKTKLENLVTDAIGIDINRGDSLTVSSSAFMNVLEGGSPWYEETWFRSAINQFAIVLILAIVILGIIRPLLNRILVPASVSSTLMSTGDEEDLDQIEIGEGSLDDIKAKLKPVAGYLC